jgi:hypothetical protein
MNRLAKVLDEGNYDCAQEGDALIISPKTSLIVACICGWTLIGCAFVVPAIVMSERQLPSLYDRLGLILIGLIAISIGPLILYFGFPQWRLSSFAVEHHFYRKKRRPTVLVWNDVERLRMLARGWDLRGSHSKVFIPFQQLSFEHRCQVDAFLRKMLSPHFDLTVKVIPGKKVVQFLVAPVLGIFAIMGCALGFAGLYLNHTIFHSFIPPIVVIWLLALWLLVVISLFIAHAIILNSQANKDNPWRYRREEQASMTHEFESVET